MTQALIRFCSASYDKHTGRYTQADPIGLNGGWNRFGYAGGNAVMWADPRGLDHPGMGPYSSGLATGVTIWQPVGWGSSSFGHVSTTVHGVTYSYGTGSMSIMPQTDYLAKNSFRNGTEVNLKLTPQQNSKLSGCLSRSQGNYDEITNNCGTPIQRCLVEVGVSDFYTRGRSMIGINRRHVLPVDLGNGLLSSGAFTGATQYPASRPASGWSAPWAK